MKLALLWLVVMVLAAVAASIGVGILAPHAVTYYDARHHIDFRVGLQLPVRVVWGAQNGWPLLAIVWALAATIGVAGWQYGRAVAKLGRSPLTMILAAQAIIGITLSFFPITFSGDPYAYVIWARLFGVHGLNPYLAFSHINAAGDDALLRCLRFYGNPPPPDDHGPLWTLLAGGLARLQIGASLWLQVWTHRFIAIAATLATTLALARLMRAQSPSRQWIGLAAFAFNPLVVYETAVGGHNDMIMVALAAWAFAVVDEYPLVAALLVGASASIKFVSLIAVPFLVVRAARGSAVRGIPVSAIVLVMMVLCFTPFWAGLPTLYALIGHTGALAMSPTWILAYPFFAAGIGNQPAFESIPALPVLGQPSWPRLIQLLLAAGVLVIATISIARYAKRADSGAIWRTITALLWTSPIIHPWYLIWLAPAAATAGNWARYAWWFATLLLLRYALDATDTGSSASLPAWALMILTAVMMVLPVIIAMRFPSEQRRTAQRATTSVP
jgi:hypothetical protein